MSFVCCQIDLAVKNLFICFHKDAHLQLLRPWKRGLEDLLGIYNQGRNQSGSRLASLTLLEEDRASNHGFCFLDLKTRLIPCYLIRFMLGRTDRAP